MIEPNEIELSLAKLTTLSKSIRRLGEVNASSQEEVAQRIASFLYESFTDPDSGATSCALVRFFQTQRFASLPRALREEALRLCGRNHLDDQVRCLTLLGTAGDHPDWRSRRASRGHQAIPLVSKETVEQLPMVYQLLVQLGIDTDALIGPNQSLMLDLERRTFNVFFVPEARGSHFIPAQTEFVEPFGVRSVVGFGSVLPDGEMIAVVIFWKRRLSANSAGMFRTLALSTKVAVLSPGRRPQFESREGEDALFGLGASSAAEPDPRHLGSLTGALRELLEIHEVTVIDQAARLESRVSELDQKNDELDKRNRELDEFTYVASHDLQEPLRKICAYSDLLEADMADDSAERAREDLKFVVDAAQRMQTLVQDLLLLSRTSRQDLKPRMVDVHDCVIKVLHSLSLAIEESGAEVLCDQLPAVWGDETLLTHLYQNLIGNALKFRDSARSPVVHLTHREDEDGRSVFGVRDNGIGISAAYRQQIFAPFRRLHGRGEYPGTGIGLAICRRAVERLGGEIWVAPEDREGSHFQFNLRTEPDLRGTSGEDANA